MRQEKMTQEPKNYPLVMTNIAMDNGPFIDDFPIKTPIYKGFSIC